MSSLTEEHIGRLSHLYVTLDQLYSAHDESGVLLAVREIMANLVGSEAIALFERGADGDLHRLALACGSDARVDPPLAPDTLAYVRSVLDRAGHSRSAGPHRPVGASSIAACVPLVWANRVRGALVIVQLLEHKTGLDDADWEIVQALSRHIAPALLLARLHHATPVGLVVRWHAATRAAARPAQAAQAVASPDALTAYLHAGHIFASAVPTRVTTILGSCVAVALWDGVAGVGGVNHFVLPQPFESSAPSTRFGQTAIEELVQAIVEQGGRRSRLSAKVFGGAHVLGTTASTRDRLGSRNVAVARRVLADLGIPIVAEDVEGRAGRKLLFWTHDGTAFVKAL